MPDNITLLPLPPYAPELNPIENVWEYLRANRLAFAVFDTYDDIVTRCCEAWNFFADNIDIVRSITRREYAKTVNLQGRWYNIPNPRSLRRLDIQVRLRPRPSVHPFPLPVASVWQCRARLPRRAFRRKARERPTA